MSRKAGLIAVVAVVATLFTAPPQPASASAPDPVVLDAGFGGTGVVDRPGGTDPRGLQLIGTTPGRAFAYDSAPEAAGTPIGIVALQPGGTALDTGYSGDGICDGPVSGRGIATFPDGSVLVESAVGIEGLHKVLPDCTQDPTYATIDTVTGSISAAETWPTGRAVLLRDYNPDAQVLESRTPTGRLDPSFAGDGVVEMDIRSTFLAREGDSVLVGQGVLADLRLERILSDGTFDPSFGTGGKRTITYQPGVVIVDGVSLAGGGYALLLVRRLDDIDPDVAVEVVRLAADGSVVAGFGTGGVTAVGGDPLAEGTALVARADGGVDVVGHRPHGPDGRDTWVTRLDAAGAPVPGYGTGGTTVIDFGAREFAVAAVSASASTLLVQVRTDRGEVVVPVGPTGAVGTPAPMRVRPAPHTVANAMTDATGRVVVVGDSSLVARILADGRSDPSFSGDGVAQPRATVANVERWDDTAAHPDGGVVVVGSSRGDVTTPIVGRLTPSGAPDPSFGASGVRRLDALASFPGFEGNTDPLVGAMVLGDGRILVAGTAQPSGAPQPQAFVVRLTSAGLPDATFGSGGVVWLALGAPGVAVDVVRAGDRVVVVAARNLQGEAFRRQAVLVPLAADGAPATPIATGVASFPAPLVVGEPTGGVTLVTRNGSTVDPRTRFVRLRRDGTIDPTLGSMFGATIDHGAIDGVVRMADGGFAYLDAYRLFRLRADGVDDPAWDVALAGGSFVELGSALLLAGDRLTFVTGGRAFGGEAALHLVRHRLVPGWLLLPGLDRSPGSALGGQFRSGLAVVSASTDQREVFGRGLDDGVWTRRVGASASGWESLGGATRDEPAVSWTDGTTRLAVRGVDGAVWLRTRPGGGAWSGWTSLGGGAIGAPAIVGGYVVIRGLDNALWFRFTGAGGVWQSLGGTVTSPPAAAWGQSSDPVVGARGVDGALWTRSLTVGWTSAGGQLVGGPALAARFDTIEAFVRGSDDVLYTNRRTGGVWSGWTSLGGRLTSMPGAVLERTPVATVSVVVRGTDGQAYETQVLPIPGGGALS